MYRSVRNLAIGAAIATTILAGCGSGSRSTPLTVFAASSLRDALPRIDGSPTYGFAGSNELATQIREGAPADVFAAASGKHPQELFRDGLVEAPVTFASNRLVAIVPAANPRRIRSVDDLRRPGVKLVIASAGVPLGDYTRQAITALSLDGALQNVVSEENDARGVVGKIALGEADAGVVYVTDAVAAGDAVRTIAVPPRAQPTIAYQVAAVRSSRRIEAARAYVAMLRGPAARQALRSAGFDVP